MRACPDSEGSFCVKAAALITALSLSSLLLAGCGSVPELTAAEQPLPKETVELVAKKGLSLGRPIFVRIFKEESELEIWKARDDGRYYHLKTYPICTWSGVIGPKIVKGDKQAPEGFYSVKPQQMKPDSSYHVAFNLGFPNAYDRAHDRTGEYLMIHGKCSSSGCYAMTDAIVEEIYAIARESFRGGQERFDVHAFPFRLTNENLERHKKHKWHSFWARLKQGYDYFEKYRVPPGIAVCERQYQIGVTVPAGRKIDPEGPCPRFERPAIEPFVPKADAQVVAEQQNVPPEGTSPVGTGGATATAAVPVAIQSSAAAE